MARTDTERLDMLARQNGNLFTPHSDIGATGAKMWAWFSDPTDARIEADGLRNLLDAMLDAEEASRAPQA